MKSCASPAAHTSRSAAKVPHAHALVSRRRPPMSKAADHHRLASTHYHDAARHQQQSAHFSGAGNHEAAAYHAAMAAEHQRNAEHHAAEAARQEPVKASEENK